MNGRQLIDKMCERLDAEDIRKYDSQIVWKISELSKYELEQLILDGK